MAKRRWNKYNKNNKKSRKNSIDKGVVFILMITFLILILSRNGVATLIVLGILVLLRLYFLTPAGKGKIGEYVVKILIKRSNPKKSHFVINNLTFYNDDRSVQIDHIIVNKKGIHVIETKNYGGTIYVDDYRENWTQSFNFGKNNFQVYSPLRQNYGHIKSLESELLIREEYFLSYIVFTGRAKLMGEYKSNVIYPVDIRKKINKNDDFLNDLEVKQIYDNLIKLSKRDKISNKTHKKNVKSYIKSKKTNLN